jgi:hypothetical protein
MADMYRDPTARPSPVQYRVARTSARPITLLPGHDPAWERADSIEWGPSAYRTHFKALWNELGLAIRFEVCDDRPWHTMTRRDDRIAEEEVVEIFLDPLRRGRDYAEVEINPINVVTDLHVLEPHPNLTSDRAWNWAGLESTVVPGTCGGLKSGSWVALAWLPWSGLRGMTADLDPLVPPKAGDRWLFNVFRIKRPNGPAEPERGAIYAGWSVPTVPSFHEPASFRDFVFG